MAKARFYLQPEKVKSEIKIIDKNSLHKLRNVLRLKKSQKIYIFNGDGKEWEYKIDEIGQKSFKINKIKKSREKPKIKPCLTLGFPLSQGKKIGFILQKATELGVSELIPFISLRSFKLKISEKKMKRWEKVVREACRQSERLWIPKIHYPVKLTQLIKKDFSLKLLASPHKNNKINFADKKFENILFLVGPEGGFSTIELEKFEKNDFNFINLSSNILRTETAAILAAGLIKYLTRK